MKNSTSGHLRLTKEWDLVQDTYKIEKIIGSGACGIVVRAKHREQRNKVAIKHVKTCFKEDHQYV